MKVTVLLVLACVVTANAAKFTFKNSDGSADLTGTQTYYEQFADAACSDCDSDTKTTLANTYTGFFSLKGMLDGSQSDTVTVACEMTGASWIKYYDASSTTESDYTTSYSKTVSANDNNTFTISLFYPYSTADSTMTTPLKCTLTSNDSNYNNLSFDAEFDLINLDAVSDEDTTKSNINVLAATAITMAILIPTAVICCCVLVCVLVGHWLLEKREKSREANDYVREEDDE